MAARISTEQFESWVEQARTGDSLARTRVVEALQPVLVGFFRRRIAAKDDVDDLVQNSLIRVLRGLNEIKDPRRMKAFAMKAALFELQDHYRGRYAKREEHLDPDGPEPTASSRPEGLALDLEKALGRLPAKARTILELKTMGYRYDEIARMLDTTEAAVKMQVRRAMERLRAFLGLPGWVLAILLLP